MSKSEGLETVRCAQVNLANLAKMIPGLKDHPFYLIVEAQITDAITQLEQSEPVRGAMEVMADRGMEQPSEPKDDEFMGGCMKSADQGMKPEALADPQHGGGADA